MNVECCAFSAKGKREHNEDCILINGKLKDLQNQDVLFESNLNSPFMYFALLDGMGGHTAGDIASNFVATCYKNFMDENVNTFTKEGLLKELERIHYSLIEKGKNDNTQNMGSTFVSLILKDDLCGFVSVGDSRIYRLRNTYLQLLSHDDSLSSIIENAPKNIITNAFGAGLDNIEIENRFTNNLCVKGDIFLLCSDGVSGYIIEDELENILQSDMSLKEKLILIAHKAYENQSDDNLSCILVKID